ncbi:MAG: hypothetical protein L6V93_07395 [Clostridiales bacterium]|nr:MAG: hypothetical protein L6V93_07395 [Clostridiales bacterium]
MFNFKRLISTAVAFVMAASVMSTAFAAIPSDVAGTEYEEAAQVLGVLDIMVGDKDTGTFRPDDTIIRSEGARVAISALGLQEVAEVTNGATKISRRGFKSLGKRIYQRCNRPGYGNR